MLVLTRKLEDQIQIGPNITITVLRVRGRSVQIGIDAPENVRMLRGEVAARIELLSEPNDTGLTAELL